MAELRLPWEVKLPMPPKGLNPNHAGRSVAGRWRLAKTYKELVYTLLLEEAGQRLHTLPDRACLEVVAVYPDRRSWMDSDNLTAAFKPGRDAYKLAGLIVDDSPAHLVTPEVQYTVDPTAKVAHLAVRLSALPPLEAPLAPPRVAEARALAAIRQDR